MAQDVLDVVVDFSGGQDVSRGVTNVPESKYYAGVNVSAKAGVLRPRWGFSRLPFTFVSGGTEDETGRTRTYKEIFEGGKFQSAVSYYINNDPFIVSVISGHIFLINLTTNFVDVIAIEGGSLLNSRTPRINRTVADEYVVFYDFPDYPVLVQGLTARRANPTNFEVPASRLGAYNQNRMFVVNGGNEFTGGDPVGSLSVDVNPPITFREVLQSGAAYFNQVFQLPTDYNREPITAAATLQAVDTSTGIGPLLLATANGIFSYGTHVPRSQWEAGQFGSSILSQVGVVGPRAFTNANADAFFVSSDGHMRTISMSRNEQKRWSSIPISREIDNWIKINDKTLLQHSTVEYFNNKVFFAVNPFRVAATDFTTRYPISDYAFGGMAVLELDNLTSFGEPSRPAWAGLWTGVRPMEFIHIDDRMFVFSKDKHSVNRVYEIDPNISYDTAEDKVRQVRSRVYTRSYSFGDRFNIKTLKTLEANIKDIKGDFEFDAKYKVDHSPYYYNWRKFSHNASWNLEDLVVDSKIGDIEGHGILDFTAGALDDQGQCNPITGELTSVFKEVQLYLSLTGIYWELSAMRLEALQKMQEHRDSLCGCYPNKVLKSEGTTDWDYEEFGECQEQQT